MTNFREKSQVFLLGLMFGLLLGGGFFILKLDDYFKELNFYKSLAKTFTTNQTISSASKEEQEGSDAEKNKKTTENVVKTKVISRSDSSFTKQNKDAVVLDSDTLKQSSNNDSLKAFTENTDDIIVRKDELLTAKTLEVNNLSLVANRNSAKDSLLQKVSGIKESSKQLINVEFWQSPLNYKGYKMSQYKIVVYGIPFSEALKVYSINDVVYLKNNATVYKLDNSTDFKPYERITDENIISKLK